MLYLAQVQQSDDDSLGLVLLAVQSIDRGWQITRDRQRHVIALPTDTDLTRNQLVLVELDSTRAVTETQDATDWVLETVKDYLSVGITPEELNQEANRLEQWKQSLTLQNQELSRRALELELRRDQLQALELSLKPATGEGGEESAAESASESTSD